MAELTQPVDDTVISTSDFGVPVVQRVVSRYDDTTERDSLALVPAAGEVCYVIADEELQAYNGTSWVALAAATDGVPVFANAAARDAALPTPTEGQLCFVAITDAQQAAEGLMWFDGSEWLAVSMITALDGLMLDEDPSSDPVVAMYVDDGTGTDKVRVFYWNSEAVVTDTGVSLSLQGGSSGQVYYRSQPQAQAGDDAVWYASGGKYYLVRTSSMRADKENVRPIGGELADIDLAIFEWTRPGSDIVEIGALADDLIAQDERLGVWDPNIEAWTNYRNRALLAVLIDKVNRLEAELAEVRR